MTLIRCTCIYRPSEPEERTATGQSITVACRDPRCPASAVHERVERARARVRSVG